MDRFRRLQLGRIADGQAVLVEVRGLRHAVQVPQFDQRRGVLVGRRTGHHRVLHEQYAPRTGFRNSLQNGYAGGWFGPSHVAGQ